MGYLRKYFKGYCKECRSQQKLTRIGEQEDENFLWLRCNNCSALNQYPIERVLQQGRVLTKKEFEKRKEAMSDIRDYSPEKTYWRGQEIRHSVLNDVGKVLSKEQTEGDHNIIVVDFEKNGKKRLVEGFAAD